MVRSYNDKDIEKIIPPSIRDARSLAIVKMAASLICNYELDEFVLSDAARVRSNFLPYLIAQNSLAEFIEPGLSEEIIRRLIKNAFSLHAMKGYDAGVIKALSMLGFRAMITQWWQESPKAYPNTHLIEVELSDQIFEGEPVNSEKTIRQIWRMINNTKRHSQETRLRLAASTHSLINYTPIIFSSQIGILSPPTITKINLRQELVYGIAIRSFAMITLTPKIISHPILLKTGFAYAAALYSINKIAIYPKETGL